MQIPNLQVLAPEAIILAFVLIVLFADALSHNKRPMLLGGLSLLGVLLAVAASVYYWGDTAPTFQGMVAADGYGMFANMLFLLAAGLSILMGLEAVRRFDLPDEVFVLILITCLGMMILGSAVNLIGVFLALEILSIALYVLTASARDELRSLEAGMKYFILGGFASAFLLFGIAMIYGATGTFSLAEVGSQGNSLAALLDSPLLAAGLLFLLVGFGFKVALVPFQMWTPDVYEGAPSLVTAFMSVGAKAAGFVALIRILQVAFPYWQSEWGLLLAIIAVLTMSWGNIAALAQTSVKRMLAYSSIAHAGYIAIGVAVAGSAGYASVLFYLLCYTLMNVGAFAVILALGRKGALHEDLDDYAGLIYRKPGLALAMGLFMLALAGIPLTAGFLGKFYIFSAAVAGGYAWLAAVGVINAVISAYYYLRVAGRMFFGAARTDAEPISISWPLGLTLALTALATLFFGVYPTPILDFIQLAIRPIVGF
jgi:NADH-quinone oxidoreductase subunit N